MPQSALVSAPPSLVDLDAANLPVAHMRQLSRITRLEAGSITGELDLGPEHWVFPQHFPGDPIFPGTMMIEAAGQLVALWAWAQGPLGRGRPRLVRAAAEFHSPVGPLHPLLVLQADVRRKRHLHFGTVRIWGAEVEVATVEAVLAVLPAVT